MGSINNNNWLGFSLSPHEQDHHHHSQNLGFNSSDEISAAQVSGECYDLTSDSVIPSLNLPPAPFAIFEAFNRNATHSQDWSMKDVGMNSFSCTPHLNQETPKLENFLGHSFADHQEQNKLHQPTTCDPITNGYPNNSGHVDNNNTFNMYQEAHHDSTSHTNNTSTMGLSMIKNWLRNNPPPPPPADNKVSSAEAEAAPPPQGAVGGALSLSMSMGSQSSDNKLQHCGAATTATTTITTTTPTAVDSTQSSGGATESVPRKSIDTFGQRTSIYRGVTRHRWTGRYEAHLWDNSCRREGQTRKGRQVYLGGYDKEEKAARAYDLAALKYWGTTTTTNFPISNYEKEMEEMKHMTRQEYVASLRRKSSGFSRGASIYRGVTRHHQHGRWQARIGRVAGNKDLYLGTFSTQEEAAEAYDIAAIKFRGLNAVTNFEISRYDVKSILESTTLPIGGAAKRLKDAENAENIALEMQGGNNLNLHLTDHGYGTTGNSTSACWPTIAFQQPHPLTNLYPYQRIWCKQEQDPDIGYNDINHNQQHSDQLQLGCATQNNNFLQTSVLHNLMSVDPSSSSSSSVYATSGMVPLVGAESQVHGFVGNDQHHHQAEKKAMGSYNEGNVYANLYNYHHHHHQSQQSSSSNGWNVIPTGLPTLAARANAMAVCHGASTFTVWNDT